MNSVFRTFIIVALLPLVAYAVLRVDNPVKDIAVGLDAAVATTQFTITNDSDAPVHIRGISTSCDCTSATVDNPQIQPHAATTARAAVKLEGRAGSFYESLLVFLDAKKPELQLAVHVVTPDVVDLSSRSVHWSIGEKLNPRTITISMPHGVNGKILHVDTGDTDLRITTKLADDGTSCVASILPPIYQTNRVGMAYTTYFTITTDVTINGKEMPKVEKIPIMVGISTPEASQPSTRP